MSTLFFSCFFFFNLERDTVLRTKEDDRMLTEMQFTVRWLNWPWLNMVVAWTWLLNMVVDRLVHACRNYRLFMAWWTNRLEQRCWNHRDKSIAMFMHDRTLTGNYEMTRLNSYAMLTTVNLVVVSNRVLHVSLTYANNACRFAKLYTLCWNMIEQY